MLCKRVCNERLCLRLIPVTNLIVKLLNLDAGILQSLYRELCSVLSIYVLRVTLDHDVGNLAIAVDITVVVEVSDDLALHGSGLTSVTSYVADLHVTICPSLLFLSIRLSVDVYERNVCCGYHIGDGCCGRRVNRVDDETVNTLGDEVLNLVGLCSLVVCTIHDLDVLCLEAEGYEIVLKLISEKGHEVIRELIDTYADLLIGKIRIRCSCSCLCCCLRSCLCSGCSGLCRCCSRSCCSSLCRLRAAASCEHRNCHC